MSLDTLQLTTKIVKSEDGTEIHAEACGDHTKPHVVFVHGLACASSVFDKLFALPDLQQNLYLVRYDARGHARSGKPVTEEAYETARYWQDFDAVCKAFDLNKPFYAGWSLAGSIAADICANNDPVPISGIIWLGALPYLGDVLPVVATPLVLSFLPGLTAPESPTHALKTRIEFCYTLVPEKRLPQVPYADLAAWIGAATHLLPECATLALSRKQDPSRLKEEGAKGLPLCIIHGAEDLQISGKDVIEQMEPHFKDCESHLLEGLGHILFWEDPEAVGNIIRKFVARVTQSNI